MRMSIMYGLNIEKINELGANWYNVVLDIAEYLESKGFQYSRTQGFVSEGKVTEIELKEIGEEIIDIALGVDNLLYLEAAEIGDTISFTGDDFRNQ